MPEEQLAEITFDDAALFDGTQGDDAPATQQEAPAAELKPDEPPASDDQGQPRDDHGRFAAKMGTPAEQAAQPVKEAQPSTEDQNGQIPAWRLREEAEARREAVRLADERQAEIARYAAENAEFKRRVEAMEMANRPQPKPPEVPDPLLDPDGYRAFVRQEVQTDLLTQQREFSLRMARRSNPQDFDEAYSTAKQAVAGGDQALAFRMQQSADPGETLLQWHREQKTMREVGNDPNAWLEKKLEERLNDPAFLAKAIEKAKVQASSTSAQAARPAIDLPPSLSGASRASSSRADPDDDGDPMSQSALFRNALR